MSYSLTRSLEIELISAEGLKIDRKPLKKKQKTFSAVRIGEKSRESKVDESGGGSFPIWNDKFEDLELPINGSVRFISIEVFYRTSGGHQKSIGFAKIPVTDFIGGFAPQGHLNFLSYRLRDEYGDKCGIVNVSILVKTDKFSTVVATAAAPGDYAAAANGQMWRQRPRVSSSSMTSFGGRLVTGVPVWPSSS